MACSNPHAHDRRPSSLVDPECRHECPLDRDNRSDLGSNLESDNDPDPQPDPDTGADQQQVSRVDPDTERLFAFKRLVRAKGRLFYRDLPWRNTRDPYGIWLSEVMLQQTQVARGVRYWNRWLELFPTVDALASASLEDVLGAWQGLGYNRRALMLHKTAGIVSEQHAGVFPRDKGSLLALPGIGPATAAGIRVFAFDLPDIYLETNVRSVFLHELMPERDDVPDRDIVPLVEATCPEHDVRGWYYALLDYGAHLKSTMPNPSRRSRSHVRQSPFEGSRRQKRACLLRAIMARGNVSFSELVDALDAEELAAGRQSVDPGEVASILSGLVSEGFATESDGAYRIRRNGQADG